MHITGTNLSLCFGFFCRLWSILSPVLHGLLSSFFCGTLGEFFSNLPRKVVVIRFICSWKSASISRYSLQTRRQRNVHIGGCAPGCCWCCCWGCDIFSALGELGYR